MSSDKEAVLRVGELLIRSGLITPDVLEDNIILAEKMRTPLAQMLDMHGVLLYTSMDAASLTQDLIDKKELTLERGVKLMELVGKQGLDFDTAYRKVTHGMEKKAEPVKHFLGELLRQAGLITKKQLADGVSQSLNTGLPLGMVLIGMQAVSLPLLNSALMAEKLIRTQAVTREQATEALRAARLRSITLTQSLLEHNFANIGTQFGTGELFVLAGLLSEAQLMSAREMELALDKPLEQIFIDFGYSSRICITAASQLLGIVHEGTISPAGAARILRKLKSATTNEEMLSVLGSIDANVDRVEELVTVNQLLEESALVGPEEFMMGSSLATQTNVQLSKILFDAGLITANALDAIHQCKAYIDRGLMTMQQAVIAIVYCQENDLPFADTIRLFGWVPTLQE